MRGGLMKKDLFEREQNILDYVSSYLEHLTEETPCSKEEYALLVKEYGKLLRQIRRITKLSDRTVEELSATKINLAERVYHDALTEIYNRCYMEEKLEEVIESLKKKREVLSILMLDVDFFKLYNDTYGHSQGDQCLRIVAKALCKELKREAEFIARYGGEEFVVVLPEINKKEACKIADRLLTSVSNCKLSHEKNKVADYVTISAGVTSGIVGKEDTGEAFIKKADEALYQSKQNGRNCYTFIPKEDENGTGYV